MLAAPVTATSLSPDKIAATAGAPGVTKTSGTSKSFFVKRPASSAIQGRIGTLPRIGFLNDLFYGRSYSAGPAELSIPVCG
jgi:hypothetical protein